jgi:hypothetical protein
MINFVSFGTSNCEQLLDSFYNNILKFYKEEFKLHYFSINYDSNIVGERLVQHKITYNKKYKKPNFYKPIVLLKSLIEIDCENFIYLDLDVLITKNFSSSTLFNYVNNSNTPLSPNHYWEYPYLFLDGKQIKMADNICEFKSIKRCCNYVQNCLIVYTKKHFEFLIDWVGLINDDEVMSMLVGDEDAYNATLWKYNQTNTLGYICVTNGTVDIDNLGCFNSIKLAHEKYESDDFDKLMFTHQNNFYKGFDNKNVMIFHGVK